MSLNGCTIFITGGSRGIGLAIALRAARDGANIVIAAKSAEPHPKLPGTIYTAAAEIEAAGGKALPIMLDVRDTETILVDLPMSRWRMLVSEDAEFIGDLARLTCARMRHSLVSLNDLLTQSSEARLIKLLIELAHCTTHDAEGLRLRQDDLANIIGVSRQVINRALKRVETTGAIKLGYTRIMIKDMAQLEMLAEQSFNDAEF